MEQNGPLRVRFGISLSLGFMLMWRLVSHSFHPRTSLIQPVAGQVSLDPLVQR